MHRHAGDRDPLSPPRLSRPGARRGGPHGSGGNPHHLTVTTSPQASCVICDTSLDDITPAVRLAAFELRICPSCRSWIALPRPTQMELAEYHDSDEYFDHPYLELRRSAAEATERRCDLVFRRFREAAPARGFDRARMLDVGCDTGNLLDAARRRHGIIPFGVDVAHAALATAARRGITVHHGTLETAPPDFSGFDVMTAIDLIEHVAEPHSLFRELARRLRPDGLLYVETPNVASAIYGVGRSLSRVTRGVPTHVFRRLFPPEHVEYYSREGLGIVAREAGLEILRMGTRPLPMSDIAVSIHVRVGLGALQVADRLRDRSALWWAVMAYSSRNRFVSG